MQATATTDRAPGWRWLAPLTAVALGLALAGCGSDEPEESSTQPPSASTERAAAQANAATIRERIIGNTVTGTMSPESAYTEYYAPNGDIRGASYVAIWTIEDDSLCLDYDESPQIDCYRVYLDGDAVEWHRQGEIQGRGTIVEGNPNNF